MKGKISFASVSLALMLLVALIVYSWTSPENEILKQLFTEWILGVPWWLQFLIVVALIQILRAEVKYIYQEFWKEKP